MAKTRSQLGGLIAVTALFSSQALALPFTQIEPRTFAMGGAGVASATNSSAVFMNPALLAVNEGSDGYDVNLPVLGYRLFDREKRLDALAFYKDSALEANYDTDLNNFKNGFYIDNDPVKQRQAIVASANDLGEQLTLLSDALVEKDVAASVVVVMPQRGKLNMALSLTAREVGGAVINNTQNDIDELLRVRNAAVDGSLLSNESFDSTQFTASMKGRGLVIQEVAVSLAQEVTVAGHDFAFGITPKYISVSSFDYDVGLNEADYDPDVGQKSGSAIDLDVGAVKRYDNGWSVGLAVKNLIGQEYDTILGNQVEVKPQLRLGVAHTTKWTNTVFDLDLTESETLGYDSKTQYLAMGSELNVFDRVRVRIGYRENFSNDETSLATTGLAWDLFGGVLDLAVGANEDEVVYAAQYGFPL